MASKITSNTENLDEDCSRQNLMQLNLRFLICFIINRDINYQLIKNDLFLQKSADARAHAHFHLFRERRREVSTADLFCF